MTPDVHNHSRGIIRSFPMEVALPHSTPFPCALTRLFLFLAAALLQFALAAGEPALPDPTPKERFKMLLQSPPAIERLIFREKLPPIPNRPVPLESGITRSTNFATFELRWRTNAMFVRRLETASDLKTSKIFRVAFSLLNDDFWFLDAGTNAFLYHMEHDRVRRGLVPPAYDAAYYRISRYGEILNLGLSHLWPGTVHWDGDRFHAQGIADKKPMFVSGQISRLNPYGVPTELTVTYSNNMGLAHYRIVYDYERYRPPFYPSRVSLRWQAPAREIEYRTYDIIEVTASTQPLPDDHFLAAALIRENRMALQYFTNDSVYVQLPSGRMLESPNGSPKLTLTGADYARNRYFYLAAALVTTAFLGLALKPQPHSTEPRRAP